MMLDFKVIANCSHCRKRISGKNNTDRLIVSIIINLDVKKNEILEWPQSKHQIAASRKQTCF